MGATTCESGILGYLQRGIERPCSQWYGVAGDREAAQILKLSDKAKTGVGYSGFAFKRRRSAWRLVSLRSTKLDWIVN